MKTLSDYSTKELHEELAKREGITELHIDTYNLVSLRDKIGDIAVIDGPVRIIINKD